MKTRLCLSAMAPLISMSAFAQQDKPNIVVILADDMGTNEIGCYGGQNLATPNIDRLANEGIRLTNNYASMAMSVPTRASLYTGLYPARHGSYQNHKATYGHVKSVAHYMADLGYRVGRTGKDHPANQPVVYPFEKIDGFTVNCVASKPPLSTNDGIKSFMQRNADEPFCLYVCSIHSHMPWDAGDASEFNAEEIKLPPNCVDNEQTRKEFCNYLAEIRLLDDEVGMVYDALEETGELDNTLVIFLGEQGPQMPFGKWTLYHYGTNSAFIARYPKEIKAGTMSDAIVQYEDILPTMIDFAGGEPVEGLDGISCLDVLYGDKAEHRDWAYGIHNNIPEGESYPIRSIQDKRYKLIVNLAPEIDYHCKYMTDPGSSMWKSWLETAKTDESAQLLVNNFLTRPAIELYDLQEDPWELNNIAGNPEHESRIKTMRAALEAWMTQQGDRGARMDTKDPESPAEKTPIEITSLDDIDNIVRNDMSGNYYLAADIEIPEGTQWIPIGATSANDTDPARFSGILDGRGHSIIGLTNTTGTSFKGLFGRLDHGIVKNLNLVNVNIKGAAPSGGVTGAMIGESTIQGVSVTGRIEAGTEAGGLVGRVARDPKHTGYNSIHDCFVNAEVAATKLSTNLINDPSCAGGIVGLVHGDDGASVAKLDIQRVYFTGKVSSAQMKNNAGNAGGIVAITQEQHAIRMTEVLCLAESLTAHTPNYFYSRRLSNPSYIEHMDKLYVPEELQITYAGDGGVGAQIPAGKIIKLPEATFRTKAFYENNLSWDFNHVWTMKDGEYPTLRYAEDDPSTGINEASEDSSYVLVSHPGCIDIKLAGKFSASVYDLAGRLAAAVTTANDHTRLQIGKGSYIIQLTQGSKQYADKVVVL